jgi:hypothetical protein
MLLGKLFGPLLPALVVLGLSCPCSADTFHKIKSQERQIQAIGDYGVKSKLYLRYLWVEDSHTDDWVQGAQVTILFDPGTGVFWWDIEPSTLRTPREKSEDYVLGYFTGGQRKIYSGRGRIIVFEGALSIHACDGRAANLDDAERQTFELLRAWSGPVDGRDRKDLFRQTLLIPTINRSVKELNGDINFNGTSPNGTYVKLVSITRKDGGWVAVVQGYWTARVTLDEDFNLKEWERVPDDHMEPAQQKP